MVGNDFIVARPRTPAARPVFAAPMTATPTPAPAPRIAITPVSFEPASASIPVTRHSPRNRAGIFAPLASKFSSFVDQLHRNSLTVFALLFLLVGLSGSQVVARYAAAQIDADTASVQAAVKPATPALTGFNTSVPKPRVAAAVQSIVNQPAHLTVGDKDVVISPETIQSWLQISGVQNGHQIIHVKADAIVASVKALAAQNVKAPTNQVTVTHEGQAPQVVVAGRDGTQLADPAALEAQALALAKNVLDAKGLQLNAPLSPLPFQAVTPAAFSKLIEVNVDTKQMYLYDNGNLSHSYPISAGAAETPTPIGQYQIYSKLPVQDMKGFNPNGTKYFQPHVRWINYFLPGGYAVHGNYWRPTSWFGVINSSHGCVSLPDDQAKEVYDWAPLGTTVITHHS